MKINIKWICVIIIGGIFMLIGNFKGFPLFTLLMEFYNTFGSIYVKSAIGNRLSSLLSIIISIIFFIILGGGISVIIGALLVLIRFHKFGKIIISLGSGMGILGMTIFFLIETTIINSIHTWSDLGFFMLRILFDLYFIGVLMTLIGRRKVKKQETKEKNLKSSGSTFLSDEPQLEKENQKIICPVCNLRNEFYNISCNNCGTELNYNLEHFL